MLDGRKALQNQRHLQMDEKTEYKIIKEIGRGASCIVYEAGYQDNIGHFHTVRIKECYPFYIKLMREQDGKLCPIEDQEKAFEEAKQKFYDAYSRNVKLHEKMGFMNSTVDSENIYAKNNTYYTVMACKEGQDYSKVEDADLKSVFERMLALAKLIKRYHDLGILYLDIKPENIFLIPETKENIVLFDFDSVIEKSALRSNEKILISYSDGFSAPELVKGNKRKICEASDIYSIGAMVYDKIFGKPPTTKEGSYGYQFDFQILKDQDVCYSRELFVLLEQFLKKTIALTAGYRYKTMDRVIEDLEQLVKAADVSATYLLSNFAYNFSDFVGRRGELEQIKHMFAARQQVIFLSGMGGIGKTELAKRYAYEQEEKYRNIVFVTFQDSLEKTICRDDILINQVEQGSNESNSEYFKRKLHVLKKVTTKDDLIIIDNFDVEYDDHLEDLLECPCRFLFTTRMDFQDYDYPQIHISEIDDMEEMFQIFRKNNSYEYEEDVLREVIQLVEKHTMTVVLLAKYLRMTDIELDEMRDKLLEIKGVTNTENIRVKHRKDKRLKAESINRHMLLLFQITDFTPEEKEILMSLSLLGPVYIKKEFLLEACKVENAKQCLQKLIQYGWVQYDSVREKIALHQIILDVIYNNLHPNSKNCLHMLQFMHEYFVQDLETFADRNNRNNLAENFMERITGDDLPYVRLCIQYCRHIHFQKAIIQKAEEISLALPMDHGNILLQQIYCLKMEAAGSFEAFFEAMKRDETEEVFFTKAADDICRYAEKAFDAIRELEGATELCMEIVRTIENICEDPIFTSNTEIYKKQMLDYAEELRNYAGVPKDELDDFYYFDEILDALRDGEQMTDVGCYDFNKQIEQLLETLDQEPLQKCFEYLETIDFSYEEEAKLKYLKKLLELCIKRKEQFQEIQVLLSISKCLLDEWIGEEEEALAYCKSAKEKYDTYAIEDSYLLHSILRQMERSYCNLDEYKKRVQIMNMCDYHLLAACDSKDQSTEKALEIWEKAAENYQYIEKYRESMDCYEKILELLEDMDTDCPNNQEKIRDYLRDCGRCQRILGDWEKAVDYYTQSITISKSEITITELPEYLEQMERKEFEKVRWSVEELCDILEQSPKRKQELEQLERCLLKYQNQEMEFKR